MKQKLFIRNFLAVPLLLAGCAARFAVIQNTPEPIASATKARLPTQAHADKPSPKPTLNKPIDLNVFAAASLTDAFAEIGNLFEADYPYVTVVFNFAGSQQLAQQINEGAPADVFASANNKQMEVVVAAGGVVSGTQRIFARNRLVAIYPKHNPGRLKVLKDLSRPGLKLVLADSEVPVGQYALDFLANAAAEETYGAAFKDDVLKNVVSYEETVKAVLVKVALGEADAGIVYSSDVTGAGADQVVQIEIPEALNVIAQYPIAPVNESMNAELAQAFINLVLSRKGQDILARYNFISVR